MKYYKLIILTIASFLIILIYFKTRPEKFNITSFGNSLSLDGKYTIIDEFMVKYKNKTNITYVQNEKENYRLKDLIDDIENNKIIKINDSNYTFQNIINNSNIMVINIGEKELIDNYNDEVYINEFINNYINLIDIINEYNKNKVYFVLFYNPFYNDKIAEVVNTVNNSLIKYLSKKDLKYYNINNIVSKNKNMIDYNNILLNNDAIKIVSKELFRINECK